VVLTVGLTGVTGATGVPKVEAGMYEIPVLPVVVVPVAGLYPPTSKLRT
jgi:hypothetical protein